MNRTEKRRLASDRKAVSISDELIKRSVAGDKSALEELATKSLPQVWRTAFLVCGGGPDVDDIAQNALIDAFTGLRTYRGTGDFLSWLNRIAVRAVYRYMRRRSFWSLVPSSDRLEKLLEQTSEYDCEAPDARTENRRILEALAIHLSGLKIKNRIVLVLSVVHGYSVSEIAETVGCSFEATKKRLQRGRLELGRRIKNDPRLRDVVKGRGDGAP